MKTLLSLLVVGVVVVGGYFAFSGNKEEVADTSTNTDTAEETEGKKMAFADFLKQGGSYKCTVNQSVNNIEASGVTYLNDGMIRGEYSTTVQGRNIDGTMIVRDGYTYSWTSMLPGQGFKAKVVESTGDGSAGTSGAYSFNAEQVGDYDCQPWTPDSSKFVVPTSITFKDVSA